jgi:4-alpha-glucanotransferase
VTLLSRRAAGVLLPVTSLPGPYGVGDFGPGASLFADFLAGARQHYWQILPLTPTSGATRHSPYHSSSAFAINPLFVSPELLVADGFLDEGDLDPAPELPPDTADYAVAERVRHRAFDTAFSRFEDAGMSGEYRRFCADQAGWLDDYALFVCLKRRHGGTAWPEWPPDLRDRVPEALGRARERYAGCFERERFVQYLADLQWKRLHAVCREKDIRIIGDMPIYVTHDSADVWARPRLFKLDGRGMPAAIAGVPPDYFSRNGQRWGNPVYDWDRHREDGYSWWADRIRRNIALFDLVRIDHFRGFVAYWEIPAREKTARNGGWIAAPAADFFDRMRAMFGDLPFIAEDLGTITRDVRAEIRRLGFPGMNVLQFAFGKDIATNPYIPHNIERHSVCYTGTHDNNTVAGWFAHELADEDKNRLFRYLGREITCGEAPGELIRLCMMSVARLAIVPMQDLPGLGSRARLNTPGTKRGNWKWRCDPALLTADLALRLRRMTEISGRA